METIKQISEKWITNQKQLLSISTPGTEQYAKLQAEIADAEKHLAAKNKLIQAALAAGYRRNSYAGTCVETGAEVKAGCGFVKQISGKWQTFSWQSVCAKFA